MIDKDLVKSIVESSLEEPMFIVDVVVKPGNNIVVEIDSDENIGIDDCITISKKVEAQLDRDAEDFELEVGSCGLTSPFKLLRQYLKNIGKDVEVLTKKGEKLVGILKKADESRFTITVASMKKTEGAKRKVLVEEDLSFGYDDVKYTKYLIIFK